MPSILGYWKLRGYAQGIRLLLTFVGEEFEDRFYTVGPGPDYNKDGWYGEKFNLGLDFPNLPYYMDGTVKITHSHAILRYIGRKYNLCGETPEELLRIDLIDEEIHDFRVKFTDVCYDPNYDEKLRDQYLKNVSKKFNEFENFLGDRPFIAGQKTSFLDFEFYEYLDMHKLMEPKCFDPFPKLKAYLDRIENIPQIKKYMASERFISYPYWNRYASFATQDSGHDKKTLA